MPTIFESAPPTAHGAYYTGFCDICRAPEVAHAVDGKLWCCKCWVENGFPPADWHPGCVAELERHKKLVAKGTMNFKSARIVERAGFAQPKTCVDCNEIQYLVIWDAGTNRGLCAGCKEERMNFDLQRKPEGRPLFPI